MAVLSSRFLVRGSWQVLRFGADLQRGPHTRHHLAALFWCSPDSSHPLTWNAFQRCSLRASVDSTSHSMVRGLFLKALCNSSTIPRCASAVIRLLRWLLTARLVDAGTRFGCCSPARPSLWQNAGARAWYRILTSRCSSLCSAVRVWQCHCRSCAATRRVGVGMQLTSREARVCDSR